MCRYTPERWDVEYPSSVHIHRIASPGSGSWREYVGFIRHVLGAAHSQASLFFGHDMHGFLPARMLAWRYRRPLIYHCHDFSDDSQRLPPGSRLVRAFERRFARSANLVIVPDAERGVVVQHKLRLKHQPIVVANAPLRQRIASTDSLKSALASKGYTFEHTVFRQGRIGSAHAIEATLRSIPDWKSATWGFVLMGPGEPSYCTKLLTLAKSLGVEHQFVILPPVGYDRVPAFTCGADVGHALYVPSHINHEYYTTASNKIMEYLAAGLAILVSDRPTLRALVEQYQCGAVVDEDSPASIATAVNNLLSNPSQSRQMGAAGAQAFAEIFSYERQFAPVLHAIRSLVAK